jgi:hypothetical protein
MKWVGLERRKNKMETNIKCYFTGKNLICNMECPVEMDGATTYFPEGINNIFYKKPAKSRYMGNHDVWEVEIYKGTRGEKNQTEEYYKLIRENDSFRKFEKVPKHKIVIHFDYWNGNSRYYPFESVNIDENEDYYISFTNPETAITPLSDVLAVTKLKKNKDYLYMDKVRFLRDNNGKLISKNSYQKGNFTIVDLLRMGAKITSCGTGTVDENGAIRNDYQLYSLFLTTDYSFKHL